MNFLINWYFLIPETLYTEFGELAKTKSDGIMEQFGLVDLSMGVSIFLVNIISYLYIGIK